MADGIVPGFELDAEQGGVVVEREAQGVEALLRGGGFVVQVGVFVEVAEALFVLFHAEGQFARFEGLVAKVLAVGGDGEDGLGVEVAVAVFGVVLVGVAHGVGLFDVGLLGVFAGELAAVGDEGFLGGFVAGFGFEVFDLPDDGFAVEDFAEYDVLSVEVGGGHGCDEELGAVGVWRG